MFAPLLKKLFGSKNEREVKRMLKTVTAINALEEQMLALSDEQLKGKTEMEALIAYLQMLGTLVDVNAAAAQEELAREKGR